MIKYEAYLPSSLYYTTLGYVFTGICLLTEAGYPTLYNPRTFPWVPLSCLGVPLNSTVGVLPREQEDSVHRGWYAGELSCRFGMITQSQTAMLHFREP